MERRQRRSWSITKGSEPRRSPARVPVRSADSSSPFVRSEICEAIRRDRTSIPIALLHRVVSVTLSGSYLEGIDLVEKLSALFSKDGWNDFVSIPRLALFPTIYEITASASTATATTASVSSQVLVHSLLNQADIIGQLSFLK